jgi:hypothetical protein
VVQSWAIALALVAIAASLLVLPRFDAVKSVRPMAEKLVRTAAPGDPYAIWPRLDAPVVYYSRRYAVELATEAELRDFVARPERVWLLIEKDDLAKLEPPLPLDEVARDDSRRDGYVLLGRP